jgi:hypothetical protein
MSRSLVGRTIRRVALLAALGVASSAVPRLVAAQAQLKLSVAVQRQASGPVITITGTNFAPDGAVTLSGSPPPNTSQPIKFGPVKADASGAFTVRMEMKCTSQSADDGFLEVTFTAIDETSKRRATARENATPWICR